MVKKIHSSSIAPNYSAQKGLSIPFLHSIITNVQYCQPPKEARLYNPFGKKLEDFRGEQG
jgi:hypothetical protein